MKNIFYFLLVLSILAKALTGISKEVPLSFKLAVQKIVNRSLDIEIQKNNAKAAHYRNYPDRLALLPDLTIRGHSTLKNSFHDKWTSTDRHSATVTARINLVKFGADLAAMRAAGIEKKRYDTLVEKFKLDAEALGAQAIFSVIQLKHNFAILDKTIHTRSSILEIANKRYKKGLLPVQEIQKITIDLKNEQARRNDAEINLAKAQALLRELLGHDSINLNWPWKNKLMSSKNWSTFKAQPNTFTQRPDFQAAQLQVDALHERSNQSWGSLWPTVDFEFQYSIGGEDFQKKSFDHEVAGLVSVTIPLFDRFQRYGQYRSQRLLQANAESYLEKIKRHTAEQITLKNHEFQLALQSARSRESLLTATRNLYQSNIKRFELGRITANNLALDESRLLDSERLAVKGWQSIHQALVELCHVQGKYLTVCLKNIL